MEFLKPWNRNPTTLAMKRIFRAKMICLTHLANGAWNKSLNFIFPTKYVIPKSLKFSHWPSKLICSILWIFTTNNRLDREGQVLNKPARLKSAKISWYCWWKKSCTSWYVVYPTIYSGIDYISTGAGFLPSTELPSRKLTVRPWRVGVGRRLFPFRKAYLHGANC